MGIHNNDLSEQSSSDQICFEMGIHNNDLSQPATRLHFKSLGRSRYDFYSNVDNMDFIVMFTYIFDYIFI